eukprot:m.322512 g.322512  ORF g.322512 m.322512 type:complete len:393 (-) comp27048_c0_seq1:69-1247(-)
MADSRVQINDTDDERTSLLPSPTVAGGGTFFTGGPAAAAVSATSRPSNKPASGKPPTQQQLAARMRTVPIAPNRRRRPKKQPVTKQQEAAIVEGFSDAEGEEPFVIRRVSTFCLAQEFTLKELCAVIANNCEYSKILNDEVVYFRNASWPVTADAYAMSTYGTVVFWSVPQKEEELLLDILRDMLSGNSLLPEAEKDMFDYCYSTAADAAFHIHDGQFLVLPEGMKTQADIFNRLAISYALATSVKLDTFEVAIQRTIEATQSIPEELAETGKINLSKTEVSKYIGELYIQKASVNLMYDILDAPDFFWDQEELGLVYTKCRKFLDIDQRVEVLNRRLDVLAELLEILRLEKSEQHNIRLEWIIIWLIVVEIVLGVADILIAFLKGVDVPGS